MREIAVSARSRRIADPRSIMYRSTMPPSLTRSRWAMFAACAMAATSVACAEGAPIDSGFVDLSSGAGGSGGTATTSTSSSAATSTTATTSSTTTSTGTGHGGSGATSTTATTSTGPACNDTGPGETNDTESKAYSLGAIDDCDGSGSSVLGVIAGAGDVDWYKFTGDDVSFCSVDATRDLTASEALRICKYAQCVNGTATPDCPDGTAADTSPDGRPGCCALQGFSMGVDCSGLDDDASIYIRIDSLDDAQCVSYSLDFHY